MPRLALTSSCFHLIQSYAQQFMQMSVKETSNKLNSLQDHYSNLATRMYRSVHTPDSCGEPAGSYLPSSADAVAETPSSAKWTAL